MKKIAIHQPNFLPWMGFFEKARMVDEFVFLDHVAFSKGSYTNRVRYFCKSSQTQKWLTLPIENAPIGTPINEIKLSSSPVWESKLIQTISQNIPSLISDELIDVIRNRQSLFLADLNIQLIKCMLTSLSIDVKSVRSSEMKLDDTDEQEVLKIARYIEASHYICGIGGHNYLDKGAFAQSGIKVDVEDFKQHLLRKGIVDEKKVGLTALYQM